MDTVFLVGGAVLVVLFLWMLRAGFRTAGRKTSVHGLPPNVTIDPTPLLTESDLSLYNLVRLAVQEQYLVFAQVPLWSFVAVEAPESARAQVLRQMALKRVDFVLVHPGSRQVEQAILVEGASSSPQQAERQRVIQSVLDAAGIKLIKLRPHKSYAVPDLVALLGLAQED
jgi:hypothetical protein